MPCRPPSPRQATLFLKLWGEGLSLARIAAKLGETLEPGEAPRSETALNALRKRMELPRRARVNGRPGNAPASERQTTLMREGFARRLSNEAVSDLVSRNLQEGEIARSPIAIQKWRTKLVGAGAARVAARSADRPDNRGTSRRGEMGGLFAGHMFEDDPRATRSIGVTRYPPPAAAVFGSSSMALCAEIG